MKRLKNVMNKMTDEDTVWTIVQNGPAALFNKKNKPIEGTTLSEAQEELTINSGHATPITYGVAVKEPYIDNHLGIIEMNAEAYEGKDYHTDR